MPTIYSASSSQWPLLQSKTEQKFKSGLLNVSAEFIRPVGNTVLPTAIETSIGAVAVWPEPTVSSGTDGFERINATGYEVWDSAASASTYGYALGELAFSIRLIDKCTQEFGCGEGKPCGSILAIRLISHSLPVIIETVHISKIGATIPDENGATIPAAPILKVFYTNGTELPPTLNITNLLPGVSPSIYSGTFESSVAVEKRMVNIKKNVFGEITETEVVYQAVPQVNFGGDFNMITTCPSP